MKGLVVGKRFDEQVTQTVRLVPKRHGLVPSCVLTFFLILKGQHFGGSEVPGSEVWGLSFQSPSFRDTHWTPSEILYFAIIFLKCSHSSEILNCYDWPVTRLSNLSMTFFIWFSICWSLSEIKIVYNLVLIYFHYSTGNCRYSLQQTINNSTISCTNQVRFYLHCKG